MAKIMQKPKLVYSRSEKLFEDIEPKYHHEIWEKIPIKLRSRTLLFSSRTNREMQFERISRNPVAKSLEDIGSRDCIYNVSEEERRENLNGDSEDSDIDHS
tara:strand:- start:79 stop:381 length:303 start_codon:yes stop_codon:yes gene_type:complete